MAWTKIELPKLIYRSADEQQLSGQVGARLVNGYIDELGHIRKRPGLTEITDLGTGKIQGLYWWDAKQALIAVTSGNIYKLNSSAGSSSALGGSTLSNNDLVSFATDGNKLVMANGGNMIVYDNSAVPITMADAAAPTTVSHVAYMDGYLLAADPSTNGRMNFSDSDNIETWNALDIFTAETNPDKIQFVDTRWREITMFGERGVEVYRNDGVSPFSRYEGAYVERGCIAKNSVQMLESGWIWLDDSRRVTTMVGRQPKPISTPFDDQIRAISGVNSASSFVIDHGVRRFYGITFPDDEKTYVYDQTTQSWAEWGIWDGSTSFNKFPGLVSVYARGWNLTVVGDYSNGKIYKIDSSNFQDDGTTIRTLIRTGHIDHGTSNKKRSNKLRIRVKRGVGSITTDHVFGLRWKNDNGVWSDWIKRSLGKAGDTEFYITYNRMGMYRSRQYEIQHTENSDFTLIEMQEDVEDLER